MTKNQQDNHGLCFKILVIDDDTAPSLYLESWLNDAASSLGITDLGFEIISPPGSHYHDFENWFAANYPNGQIQDNMYDCLILDVMFKAKDGSKQTRGGYELWKYIKDHGIDDAFSDIVVFSGGAEAKKLFSSDRSLLHNIPKSYNRFTSLFKKILKGFRERYREK